eukprot:TRINITY_DN348_c0_g1_i1.p1 TRINITY_DN348_c0_g1~~TRINITY_DN348_c0_g1_i1.p1  ORF type:complete len:231 (-),score=41.47 TRINITY_DN348_c0_g1_i1:275-967(-)
MEQEHPIPQCAGGEGGGVTDNVNSEVAVVDDDDSEHFVDIETLHGDGLLPLPCSLPAGQGRVHPSEHPRYCYGCKVRHVGKWRTAPPRNHPQAEPGRSRWKKAWKVPDGEEGDIRVCVAWCKEGFDRHKPKFKLYIDGPAREIDASSERAHRKKARDKKRKSIQDEESASKRQKVDEKDNGELEAKKAELAQLHEKVRQLTKEVAKASTSARVLEEKHRGEHLEGRVQAT